MKPKSTLRSFLAASSTLLALFFAGQAQAVTYTWSNLDNATPVTNGNWSSGESWSAVPVSAADTTLGFGYTYGSNSTAETNTLTNDIADPFQLNVLTLGGATPNAANGSNVATINIAGSPLDFVLNGATTPQVNLSQNRSNGQVVAFNVQSNLVLDANPLFTGNGTGNFTISGGISGAGSFTKGGTSKLTLSGTNTYAGTTTISGGTLQFTNQVSLYNNDTVAGGWTADNISAASGATLALNVGGTGQFTATSVNTLLSNLSGANGTSTTGFAAGSTIAFDTANAAGGTFTVSGNIVDSTGTGGGAVAVTKQGGTGTNTLVLSGANTYTGTTALAGGTLALNPGANVQTIGNIALAHTGSDMTLNLNGSSPGNTAGNITQSGTSSNGVRSTINKLSAGNWTVGNITGVGTSRIILQPQAGTLSVAQIVSGVDLRMSSTGTLQLRTAGNHGVGILNAGTNGAGLAGTIDNSSGGLITFNLNPAIAVVGNFTLNGSSLNMGTGAVVLTANRQVTVSETSSSLTFGGIISGTGFGLTKAGAGTLALSGANSYSGGTTISNGTLKLGANNVLANASNVSIGTATLDADTRTDLAGTLDVTGSAVINLGSGAALAFADSDAIDWTGGTLNITGTFVSGNDTDIGNPGSLRFGIDNTGLTAPQLTEISVNGSGAGTYTLDAFGYLKASGGGSPYDTWAAAKGLTGLAGSSTDPAMGADPDGDGNNNLYEFAFDGNPTSGVNDGKIVGKVATVGSDQVMTLTLPVRTGAIFSDSSGDQLSALIDGIYYRIEGDVSLSPFVDTITEVTGGDAITIQTGLPSLSTGWTYRTFRAPGTVPTAPKAFLRAKISETP